MFLFVYNYGTSSQTWAAAKPSVLVVLVCKDDQHEGLELQIASSDSLDAIHTHTESSGLYLWLEKVLSL